MQQQLLLQFLPSTWVKSLSFSHVHQSFLVLLPFHLKLIRDGIQLGEISFSSPKLRLGFGETLKGLLQLRRLYGSDESGVVACCSGPCFFPSVLLCLLLGNDG